MKKDGMALYIFLCAAFGSLFWLGSFVFLSGAFEVKLEEKREPVTPPAVVEADLPVIYPSGFYVIAVSDEEGKIAHFFVQYADFIRDTLVFVEVPENTKLEFSAGAYEVLSVHKPEIPKLFLLSELLSITSKELFCMAAEEAVAGLFGVRPKACYLMGEEQFEGLTKMTEEGIRFLPPESVRETMSDVQNNSVTDQSLKDILVYTESYKDIREIYYRRLPGDDGSGEYRPDLLAAKEMAERLGVGLFEEEPYAPERKR